MVCTPGSIACSRTIAPAICNAYGSNVDVDDEGNVIGILDARKVLTSYRALCAMEGKNCDKVIVIGE